MGKRPLGDDQPQQQARSSEIMTVKDVAAFLGVSETAIYKLFQDGSIPARRIGKKWLCTRSSVLKFLNHGNGNGNGNGSNNGGEDIDRVIESRDKAQIAKMLKTQKVKAGKGD
jgi:excisionase family DNA binding protein